MCGINGCRNTCLLHEGIENEEEDNKSMQSKMKNITADRNITTRSKHHYHNSAEIPCTSNKRC